MPDLHSDRGQASVELVALLPACVLVALLLWQAVVAAQAVWLSGAAARAAARAQAVGADPLAAARGTLPPELRARLRVDGSARTGVTVHIPIPLVLRGARLGTVTGRARLRDQAP